MEQLPHPLGHRRRLALRHRPAPQPRADALTSSEQSADAEYRYQVQLLDSAEARLQVTCWCRLLGGTSWQRRCGPMALAVFIQRFLPGELP